MAPTQFTFYFQSEMPVFGTALPTFSVGLPSQVNPVGDALQAYTEVCYRGHSKFCQVDNEDYQVQVGSDKIWLTPSY